MDREGIQRQGHIEGLCESTGTASETRGFTIKQIADLFRITRGAIRFYQEKGLVNPAVADNGYRLYSIDDFFQLVYLKRYAAMSVPLDEIAARFRREADESMDDVACYLADREAEVRRRIAEEQRRLRSLVRFRERMQGMRGGAVRFVDAPEHWVIGRDEISAAVREDPAALEGLISLLPETIIGGTYDLRPPGSYLGSELRIEVPAARAAGLARSRFFRTLPAARLAVATVRCALGEGRPDVDAQLLGGFADLSRRVAEKGEAPTERGFSELVFVHHEQGEQVEYHALYLVVEGPREGFPK